MGPVPIEGNALAAFAAVILIDVVLSGDNAIVIGLAVAGLKEGHRRRVILFGVLAATAMRILFALVALPLLDILGLTLAGGILLLWVAWKMWREARGSHAAPQISPAGAPGAAASGSGMAREASAFGALTRIVLADLSMSLDNVLAVAGAAREHPWVLVVGLLLSVALMAVASTVIARLLDRHRWLVYVGLAVVAFVALHMIWEGGWQVWRAVRFMHGA